jgi:hypothetical protein
VAFDVDGSPRYDYPVLAYDRHYYPSLPMRVAQIYLGIPWDSVAVRPGAGIALGPVWLPTDALMRTVVNYRGPPGTYPTFSFSDASAGTIPAEALRDRIVLVGTSVVGIKDTFHTPYTPVLPGVERLATLIDSTLHGDAVRKQGGILRMYHRDSPGSASIHEEATYSVNVPFMPVFNNLVIYNQDVAQNSMENSLDDRSRAGRELGLERRQQDAHLQAAQGVKWHDGKPFTAADVKCTFDMLMGKVAAESFRKNPRKILV